LAPSQGATISWGFSDFDHFFHPMAPGELVTIAARPSVGKSSLMRAVAYHAAQAGEHVQVESFESLAPAIARNMAANLSQVCAAGLERANPAARKDYLAGLKRLRLPTLHVFDSDPSLAGVISRHASLELKHGAVRRVFIDYLGLMSDCEPRRGEMQTQAIGRVTRTLKQFAMREGVAVCLLCQLNRDSAKEANREPRLDDLRASGDIEQDSDRVILLHRPDENPITRMAQSANSNPDDEPTWGIKAIQAKGRDVGNGCVILSFRRRTATFQQVTATQQTP
jgi:replicative DNA helicase